MKKRKCRKKDVESVEIRNNPPGSGTRWIRKCANCGQDQDTQHLPGKYRHNINHTKTKTFKIEWESKSEWEGGRWNKEVYFALDDIFCYLMAEMPRY